MKCHQAGTDREVTIQIFANDYACPEFVLPTASSSDPDTLECFVPVSDGEKITVKGHFKGTILHGAIDLLGDGSFLSDTRMEGRKGIVKVFNRKIDFPNVFDVPRPDDWPAAYPLTTVVEGDLHVNPLEEAPDGTSHGGYGIGSIALIVSLNKHTEDNYEIKPPYASTTCGDWKTQDEMGCTGGITPTHELSVKVTDENVHINRQSKHRRHAEQIRFGPRPWAKFIFYYRSRLAIEQAGCVNRPERSHALGSGIEGPVTASPDDAMNSVRAEGDIADRQGGFSTSPVPVEKKQKLFGQPLFKRTAPQSMSLEFHHQDMGPIVDTASPPAEPVLGDPKSRKHSFSSVDTSRASSPSKKPRIGGKRASLLAAMEEKLKFKEAAKKDFEELKRAKEVMRKEIEEEKELKEAEEREMGGAGG